MNLWPSRLHWNVEPASVEVNFSLTRCRLVWRFGFFVRRRVGGGARHLRQGRLRAGVLGDVAVAVAVGVRLEHRGDVGPVGVQRRREHEVVGGVRVEGAAALLTSPATPETAQAIPDAVHPSASFWPARIGSRSGKVLDLDSATRLLRALGGDEQTVRRWSRGGARPRAPGRTCCWSRS